MKTRRVWIATAMGLLAALTGGALISAPASAESAEVTISTTSWYWEEAQKEEFKDPSGNTVVVETPNPFCPGAGSGTGNPAATCAQGRIPIEIRQGDYETPNKLSAVAFDLSLVPVGSEVSRFTATFREAKTGCYETDGKVDQDPADDQCEETDPQNVGNHKLRACLVNSYFGEGDAREYTEVTKYTCSAGDPVATRKEVKGDKDGPGSDFYWTFDLTSYAQDWLTKFTTNTSIMIIGVPLNKDDTETWRVVLAGAKFENGFTSNIQFTAPAIPPVAPPPPGTTGTTTTGTDFGSTGTSTDFGSTGTGSGTSDFGDSGTTDPAPAASGGAPVLATEGAEATPAGLPGYVWLGLLAGFIGFTLVRSVVLESASGIRPNGVLATIHRINSDGKGSAAAVAATGGLGSLGSGLRSVGGRVGSLFGKLNFKKKG